MSLLKRLFSGKGEEPPPPPPPNTIPLGFDVQTFVAALEDELIEGPGDAADPDVIRAKLADMYRSIEVEPLDPEEMDRLSEGLDEGAWARIGLLIAMLKRMSLEEVLKVLLVGRSVPVQVKEGFLDVARETPLLTLELLGTSSLRVEELARRWLRGVGGMVAGESAEASRMALNRLDYGRLLAEVDRAKMTAEQRAAYLRRLQQEHEASRPRRGKV